MPANRAGFQQMLPYGAVMATAGTAVLARPCGLHVLTVPLLVWSMVQAIWIAAMGAKRWPERWRHPGVWLMSLRSPREHCGAHTVPLGLAIIAGTLAGLVAIRDRTVVPWVLLWTVLTLTWIASVACVGRFVTALARCRCALEDVDGAWFLIPAVALGAAAATANAIPDAINGWRVILGIVAMLAAAVGWSAYWLVATVTAWRIYNCGLGSAPRTHWWIAMGCAGLAAATLGKVLDAAAWPLPVRAALATAMFMAFFTSLILLVPVLVLSLRFLVWRCRFRGSASWPPTFSMAVFAMGSLAAWTTSGTPAFRVLGLAGAFATVVLWVITSTWATMQRLRHLANPLLHKYR